MNSKLEISACTINNTTFEYIYNTYQLGVFFHLVWWTAQSWWLNVSHDSLKYIGFYQNRLNILFGG